MVVFLKKIQWADKNVTVTRGIAIHLLYTDVLLEFGWFVKNGAKYMSKNMFQKTILNGPYIRFCMSPLDC